MLELICNSYETDGQALMMSCKYSLLLLVYFTSSVYSSRLLTPCKTTDAECINKSVQNAIPKILAGIPELGIESSDPLNVKKITGDLSTLKYNFYDTIYTGYKDCKVLNLKVSPDLVNLHFELECPSIKMKGKYDISGRLLVLPVEGTGDYSIITGKYKVTVESVLKTTTGSDGKNYLNIKNFKLECKPVEAIKFDFKNLFNGQKDLSDAVHKFSNENWSEVATFVQDPVWNAVFGEIIKHVNKYLKTVPLDEYRLN